MESTGDRPALSEDAPDPASPFSVDDLDAVEVTFAVKDKEFSSDFSPRDSASALAIPKSQTKPKKKKKSGFPFSSRVRKSSSKAKDKGFAAQKFAMGRSSARRRRRKPRHIGTGQYNEYTIESKAFEYKSLSELRKGFYQRLASTSGSILPLVSSSNLQLENNDSNTSSKDSKNEESAACFWMTLSWTALVSRLFPAVSWVPMYSKSLLRADIVAAATVVILLIPQSMAYASLAGMPEIYGLYACIVPLMLYSLLGTSSQLAVGPVAPTAILIASATGRVLNSMGEDATVQTDEWVSAALTISFLAGICLLVLGVLRFGAIVKLLSRPVMSGYIMSAAFIIFANQIKTLFKLDMKRSEYFYTTVYEIFASLHTAHWKTSLVSLCCLSVLFWPKLFPSTPRIPRWFPLPLLLLVTVTAFSYLLNLKDMNVAVVGGVKSGLPQPILPKMRYITSESLMSAFIVAIVSYLGTIALVSSFGNRATERYRTQLEEYNERMFEALGFDWDEEADTGTAKNGDEKKGNSKSSISSVEFEVDDSGANAKSQGSKIRKWKMGTSAKHSSGITAMDASGKELCPLKEDSSSALLRGTPTAVAVNIEVDTEDEENTTAIGGIAAAETGEDSDYVRFTSPKMAAQRTDMLIAVDSDSGSEVAAFGVGPNYNGSGIGKPVIVVRTPQAQRRLSAMTIEEDLEVSPNMRPLDASRLMPQLASDVLLTPPPTANTSTEDLSALSSIGPANRSGIFSADEDSADLRSDVELMAAKHRADARRERRRMSADVATIDEIKTAEFVVESEKEKEKEVLEGNATLDVSKLQPPTLPLALKPDANQEFVAFGVCCVLGALFSSFVTSGSFSRTALNFEMSGQTQVASVLEAVVCLLFVSLMTDLLSPLPKCALAAVVASSVYRLICNGIGELKFLWAVSRAELCEFVVALLLPWFVGLELGIALAVFCSVAVKLYLASTSEVATLGLLRGSKTKYASLDRFHDSHKVNGVCIIELRAEVSFLNFGLLYERIVHEINVENTGHFVLSLSLTTRVDSTSLRQLGSLFTDHKYCFFALVQVRGNVRAMIRRISHTGNFPLNQNVRMFLTIHDGVSYCRALMREAHSHEFSDSFEDNEAAPKTVAVGMPHFKRSETEEKRDDTTEADLESAA